MKPRFLGLLAVFASLGFGWWLIDRPHSSRELLIAMTAWVLGFWVATGVRSARGRPPAGSEDGFVEDDGYEDPEEFEQEYEEEYEEEAEEEEYEEDEEDPRHGR